MLKMSVRQSLFPNKTQILKIARLKAKKKLKQKNQSFFPKKNVHLLPRHHKPGADGLFVLKINIIIIMVVVVLFFE